MGNWDGQLDTITARLTASSDYETGNASEIVCYFIWNLFYKAFSHIIKMN